VAKRKEQRNEKETMALMPSKAKTTKKQTRTQRWNKKVAKERGEDRNRRKGNEK
jgi:hypothetical protein